MKKYDCVLGRIGAHFSIKLRISCLNLPLSAIICKWRLTFYKGIPFTAVKFISASGITMPQKSNKRPRRQRPVTSVAKPDTVFSADQKVSNSQDAISFARALKDGVDRLDDEQCRLLWKMVEAGKELRFLAKKAAAFWGDEFDGGTAEVAGPIVYREILKRLNQVDFVHNPEPAREMMAEYAGYQIWFETPACIYSIKGPSVLEFFAPKFLPINGMDVEDAAHALDIIQQLPSAISNG